MCVYVLVSSVNTYAFSSVIILPPKFLGLLYILILIPLIFPSIIPFTTFWLCPLFIFFLSIYLSTDLFIYQLIYLIYLLIYLSIYLPTDLSILIYLYLFTNLSIYLLLSLLQPSPSPIYPSLSLTPSPFISLTTSPPGGGRESAG